MKRNILISISVVILFTINSCKQSSTSAYKDIKETEKELFSPKSLDAKDFNLKAGDLVKKYMNFANNFKTDSNSAEFVYKAAEITMNTANPNDAIMMLDTLLSRYPTSPRIPYGIFLKGFIYDNILKDLGKARENYNLFLRNYPSHDLADDALACLNNLGKSDAELIKELEQKNNQVTKK